MIRGGQDGGIDGSGPDDDPTVAGEADGTGTTSGMFDVPALRALWDARGIAVVGATDSAGALGRLPVEHLVRYGYRGRIAPVNPKGGTVCGLPAWPTLTEAAAGGAIDLALVMVPAAAAPDVVREAGVAGVGVCVVMSSGFASSLTDAGPRDSRSTICRLPGSASAWNIRSIWAVS